MRKSTAMASVAKPTKNTVFTRNSDEVHQNQSRSGNKQTGDLHPTAMKLCDFIPQNILLDDDSTTTSTDTSRVVVPGLSDVQPEQLPGKQEYPNWRSLLLPSLPISEHPINFTTTDEKRKVLMDFVEQPEGDAAFTLSRCNYELDESVRYFNEYPALSQKFNKKKYKKTSVNVTVEPEFNDNPSSALEIKERETQLQIQIKGDGDDNKKQQKKELLIVTKDMPERMATPPPKPISDNMPVTSQSAVISTVELEDTKLRKLIDITNKSKEACVSALSKFDNDLNNAALFLTEKQTVGDFVTVVNKKKTCRVPITKTNSQINVQVNYQTKSAKSNSTDKGYANNQNRSQNGGGYNSRDRSYDGQRQPTKKR